MAPYVLCILDGFGLNPNPKGNAVHLAQTPHFDRLFTQCPSSTLTTFGEAVGLPAGQMGNSEVGHLNIGAGRVVEQWLLRIDRELAGAYLSKSREFRNFIANSANSNTIHLIGLYSKGGVHSAHSHLLALLPQLRQRTNAALALHLFTDGRDVSPTAAVEDLGELEQAISDIDNCEIATICGRF